MAGEVSIIGDSNRVASPDSVTGVQAVSGISVDRSIVPGELRREVSGSRPFPPPLSMYIAISSRLQTPSLSNALLRLFLIICSLVPTILAIS
jgi:hypothetical protein